MKSSNKISEKKIKKYTFTDGAFISPIFIDGKYRWIVVEFDGDTYCDGNVIYPDTEADSIMELAYQEGLDYGDEQTS